MLEDTDKSFVSDACQINDLDHKQESRHLRKFVYAGVDVSGACQINDLDHRVLRMRLSVWFQMPVRSMT